MTWLKKLLDLPFRRTVDAQSMTQRERLTVFFFSLIIAFLLWLVVSLGRDYTTEVPFVLMVGRVPDQLALTSALPDTVFATITTEGWKVLRFSWYPEKITIDVSENTVNLFDRIRDLIGSRDITIISTQPMVLTVNLDRKISKKIPVTVQHNLDFKGAYGMVEALSAQPDSITITGAQSVLKQIPSWPTTVLEKAAIDQPISETVPLKTPPSIVSLSTQNVLVQARVSEFTEGEQRTRIEIQNQPKNSSITFNPALISIRYIIPIEQYASAQKVTLFRATIAYEEIQKDSTGYIAPIITTLSDTLKTKVRLVQPRRVAYYKVIQ